MILVSVAKIELVKNAKKTIVPAKLAMTIMV